MKKFMKCFLGTLLCLTAVGLTVLLLGLVLLLPSGKTLTRGGQEYNLSKGREKVIQKE